MANNKSINVKVSTKKVIDALQKALETRKKSLIDDEKARKEHEQANKVFRDGLADLFRDGKGKVLHVSKVSGYRYNEENNKWEITVEFPASVKAPKEPDYSSNTAWVVKAEIEELENAIAVLKMTDEEVVSTSTYKGVAQYIK